MHRIRYKICGIKTREIADCAVENGADALGFVFYEKSPRNISAADAAAIIRTLPAFVARTGVFVGNDIGFIKKTAEISGIDTVQVIGNESELDTRFIKELKETTGLPVILAVRTDKLGAAELTRIQGMARTMKDWVSNYLVDKFDAGEFGGTGKTVDLPGDIASGGNQELELFVRNRIILAGGIHAGNLKDILDKIRPYGVDISSGVESEKGVKDRKLVSEFLGKAAELSGSRS